MRILTSSPHNPTSFGFSTGSSYGPYLPLWGQRAVRNLLRAMPCPKDRKAMVSNSFLHIDAPLGSNGDFSNPQSSLTADVLPSEASQLAQSPFRALPGNTERANCLQSPPQAPWHLSFSFSNTSSFPSGSCLCSPLFLWCCSQACSLGHFGAFTLPFLPPPQATCLCLKFGCSGSPICCSLCGAPMASYRRRFPLCAVVVGRHISLSLGWKQLKQPNAGAVSPFPVHPQSLVQCRQQRSHSLSAYGMTEVPTFSATAQQDGNLTWAHDPLAVSLRRRSHQLFVILACAAKCSGSVSSFRHPCKSLLSTYYVSGIGWWTKSASHSQEAQQGRLKSWTVSLFHLTS